jgi:hypothetical protein
MDEKYFQQAMALHNAYRIRIGEGTLPFSDLTLENQRAVLAFAQELKDMENNINGH